MRPDARKITVTERPEVPWLAVLFGFGPMLPLVAGSLFAWWRRDDVGGAGRTDRRSVHVASRE